MSAESKSVSSSATTGVNNGEHDPEQIRLMEEECILVDATDKVVGHGSKRYCHLMSNIKKGVLHRAFSVCLFNSKGELLLQQRAASKITFPLRWTNTCCSHPLYVKDELEEKDHLGVRRAARRKLEHELGISPSELPLEDIHHLTTIHYLADSDGGEWGEHEVDHILFIQKDVKLNANPNEVAAVEYVTPEQLRKLFDDRKKKELFISPWFHMIANRFLYGWWEQLSTIIANKGIGKEESEKIYKLELRDDDAPSSSSSGACAGSGGCSSSSCAEAKDKGGKPSGKACASTSAACARGSGCA
jgi:isopentenyl-diphosphate delta-isomerase